MMEEFHLFDTESNGAEHVEAEPHSAADREEADNHEIGGLGYVEPDSVLQEASNPLFSNNRGASAQRRPPLGIVLTTPSPYSTMSDRTRPSRMNDDDDDDDDTMGFFLARPRTKLKSPSPFSRRSKPIVNTPVSRQSPGTLLSLKASQGSFLDNSGYSMSTLGKIAPSILEEASGFIRQRLAEHTLTAFTEKAAIAKAKSFLRKWKYAAELSRLWNHQDYNLHVRWVFKRTSQTFKQWSELTGTHKTRRRLVSFAVAKVNHNCVYIALSAWIDMRTQYDRIDRLERKTEWRTMRVVLNAWAWTAASLAVRNERIHALQTKHLQNLGRRCLYDMKDELTMIKSFVSIDGMVRKLNRLQLHTFFRQWLDRMEYAVRFERAAVTSEWRWGLVVQREALDAWHRLSGFTRQNKHRFAATQRKVASAALCAAFRGWEEQTMFAKYASRSIRQRRNRRELAMKEFSLAGLGFECARMKRVRLVMERVCENYIRNMVTDMLYGWMDVVFDIRMRERSNRKVARHYFDTHRKVLHVWDSVTKRAKRWRHVLQIFKKKIDPPILVKFFDLWQQSSYQYWVWWRKSDKIRARTSRWLQATFFVEWFNRHRMRSRFVAATVKREAHFCRTALYEWADQVSAALAWEAWTEQAVGTVRKRSETRRKAELLDLWYLKVRRRRHIDDKISMKEDAEPPRILREFTELWSDWCVDRRVREIKVEDKLARIRRRAIKGPFDALTETTYVLKTLLQRGTVVKRAQAGRVVARVFQAWAGDWLLRQARERGLMAQATRTSIRISKRVFAAWVELHEVRRQLLGKDSKIAEQIVPRWTLSWAMRLWVDKHNRTMEYDKMVAREGLDTQRKGFAVWEASVAMRRRQMTQLEQIDARVCQRALRVAAAGWFGEAQRLKHRTALLAMSELRTAARSQWRNFGAWRVLCLTRERARNKLARGKAAGRERREKGAMERWSLWMGLVEEGEREAARRAWRKRMEEARRMLAGWSSAGKAMWEREKRLRSIRSKRLDKECREALGRWRRAAEGGQRLAKRHVLLQSIVERRSCWGALRAWAAFARDSVSTLHAIARRRRSVVLHSLRASFNAWATQHRLLRKQAMALQEKTRRARVQVEGGALDAWLLVHRRQRRMTSRVQDWEQRALSSTWGAWLARQRYVLSLRVRARKCLVRGEQRRLVHAMEVWAMATNVRIERRLELLRMQRRADGRALAHFWHAMVGGTALVRMQGVAARRLEQAAAKIHARAAAQMLREHAAKRKKTRRAAERIVLAHRVRMLRQAFGQWEGAAKSRKRTQQVLSQAMNLMERGGEILD